MTKQDKPPLDRWRFDAAVDQKVVPQERLWGAQAIATAMGVSVATVYRWTAAANCDVPISRPNGRYFALRSELLRWMQEPARY